MNTIFKIFTFLCSTIISLQAFSIESGVFMLVKGKVFIEAESGSRKEAKVTSRIFEGQSVITEVDSRAKIVMSDRNVIIVQPRTRLKIEKYKSNQQERNTSLNLIEGKIRVNVQNDYDMESTKFEVRTNTAVAGVRGTQFITEYDKQKDLTEVTTIEGKVEIRVFGPSSKGNSEKIVINAGHRVTASGDGKFGQVEKIPNEEIIDIDNKSNVRNEEKRNQINGGKNLEGAVGGVENNEPLRPKNNLTPEPRDELVRPPVNDKTKVNVIIGK
jgi:hypothetical protein